MPPWAKTNDARAEKKRPSGKEKEINAIVNS